MEFLRITLAGFFMGLANLVPGVSGGTMVLALGFYDQFIGAFARISKLQFFKKDILFLAILFGISFVTILGLSGVVQVLMETHRPNMLGLFIGFTLGGIPALYGEVAHKQKTAIFWLMTLLGIVLMGLIAFVFKPSALPLSFLIYFIGGIIGSSAMILPGISGSYLLLILGLYLPIIGAIHQFKNALVGGNWEGILEVGSSVIFPFTLGMAVGIIVLSNILNLLLKKYEINTKGFLLGLLVGSVLGLYPFAPRPLEKVLKYADINQGNSVLHIRLYGDIDQDKRTKDSIMQLSEFGVELDIKKYENLQNISIAQAKINKAVIVLYDQELHEGLRTKLQSNKVPYVVLSNISFSYAKASFIILLIVIGALFTYGIGKIKRKE